MVGRCSYPWRKKHVGDQGQTVVVYLGSSNLVALDSRSGRFSPLSVQSLCRIFTSSLPRTRGRGIFLENGRVALMFSQGPVGAENAAQQRCSPSCTSC